MTSLPISSLPDDHMVVGYVAHLKVLDDEGNLYYAIRAKDLSDMEAYGLAVNMVDSFRIDLERSKKREEPE